MLEKLPFIRRPQYTDIASEESASFISESPNRDQTRDQASERRSTNVAFLAICLVGSALLGGCVGYFLSGVQHDLSRTCTSFVSQGSPVTEDLDIKYTVKSFNGSFMHENIYRKAASPEVDAAWAALGIDYRPARIPDSQAARAGLTKSHVHIRQKYGGGYPGNVEGLHHLHCLNLVRKALWYNYDYYHALGDGAFKNKDNIVKLHVTHCLDIIRQQLMCTVDTGVLGQIWWNPEEPTAFVDFNTKHKCKNFEAIRKWAEERQLPSDEETPPDFLEPVTSDTEIFGEIP